MTTTIRTAVIEPPFVPYDRPDDPSVLNQIAAMPRYLLYYGSIYRLKEADVLATALPPLLDQILT